MSWLSDLFTGTRPDMRLPGYAEGRLTGLDDYINSIGLGYAGKQAKRELKQFDEDPASLATLSAAKGAVDERSAAERGGQGANALIGAAGGEQANLLQSNMAHQRDARGEQTGLNMITEALGRRGQDQQALQHAIDTQGQLIAGGQGMKNAIYGLGYDATKRGGIFNPQTWGSALSAFASGAGMGL